MDTCTRWIKTVARRGVDCTEEFKGPNDQGMLQRDVDSAIISKLRGIRVMGLRVVTILTQRRHADSACGAVSTRGLSICGKTSRMILTPEERSIAGKLLDRSVLRSKRAGPGSGAWIATVRTACWTHGTQDELGKLSDPRCCAYQHRSHQAQIKIDVSIRSRHSRQRSFDCEDRSHNKLTRMD